MLRTLLALTLLATTATACAQFQLHDAHTTASLRGIDNVGSGVAWASGTDGTILRTVDSGEHWQLCSKPPNSKLNGTGYPTLDTRSAAGWYRALRRASLLRLLG